MLKIIWNVVKKIFGVFFLLCSPLKRLWCRRKRRTSDTILPLANHYPSVENLNSNYTPLNGNTGPELAPWDSWEDQQQQKVRSVEEYRQRQLLQQQNSEEPEPEPDYFQDMMPKYQKQKKVLIKKKEDTYSGSISSKLAVAEDLPVMQMSELGSWEDEQNAWEEEAVDEDDLAWEADNVIREKKRLERQERHLLQQKRKQERDQQRHAKSQSHLSAVKLS